MSKVKLYSGTKAKVNAKSVEEGALYVSTDTSELLADLGGKRLTVGKQYANATSSAAGLMSATDKGKLDGIAAGAQVNTITGVKGGAESAYRTGQVNITAANIGLGNVNNTSDASKTVAKANALTNAHSFSITGGATAAAVSFNGSADVALNVTSLDATKLSGTVPLDNLPAGALERLVVVADDAARLKLTSANVQNGDTVKVNSTGKMYFVSDETKLGAEGAFTVYTAGSATSVPWSGVTGKPATFAPSTHTHNYAGSSSAGGVATKALGDNAGQQIDSTYIKSLSASGRTITYTKGNGTTGTVTTQDNDTWIAFKGATSSADGTAGYAPAPAAGSANRYLRSDGTWSVPPDTNTTYGVASTSANGLMSSSDKGKLDGIAAGANNYTHPAYTQRTSGLYKVTVDSKGHVSDATAVTKADITALGIPGQDTNTTYSNFKAATSGAAGGPGLVPAPAAGKNTSYLRGDGTWAVPVNTTYSNFKGATGSAAGSPGLVPAPASGATHSFLKSDGTWGTASTVVVSSTQPTDPNAMLWIKP